jgi:K+-sensing histidine kinase KdpD
MAIDTPPLEQGLARTLTRHEDEPTRARTPLRMYVFAAVACAVTTAVATPLLRYFDPPNIVMLYLLTVLLIAMRLGYGPGVMAALLSVALFDFFFVPPRFSFAVHDMQYLLTFAVMLVVALITAHLSAGLRDQAALAAYFPLIASRRVYGVLAVRSSDATGTVLREQAELLDVAASLVSIVVERLERAQQGFASEA